MKKFYRATEVASYLSIGLSTVWLYAKKGRITPKKLSPRVTVFDIEEICRVFNINNAQHQNTLQYRSIGYKTVDVADTKDKQ